MEDMASIFAGCRTIAVVGMSNNPARASHDVARYLMDFYQVIPVNPNFESLLGLTCYPDLQSIPVSTHINLPNPSKSTSMSSHPSGFSRITPISRRP